MPSVPASARLLAPAETRIPRASLLKIAPALPGQSVRVCPARFRLATLSELKLTGVQCRSAANPPLGDQFPSIGKAKFSIRPPGNAPETRASPAKPIAPPGSWTICNSGKATKLSPARYSARLNLARPPPDPFSSNRPVICGRPPPVTTLPETRGPARRPVTNESCDKVTSRAPLPPSQTAPGTDRLVSAPVWRRS